MQISCTKVEQNCELNWSGDSPDSPVEWRLSRANLLQRKPCPNLCCVPKECAQLPRWADVYNSLQCTLCYIFQCSLCYILQCTLCFAFISHFDFCILQFYIWMCQGVRPTTRWTDVHNAHHCNPVEFAPVTFCNDLNTSDCAISHFATLQSSSVHTNMMLLVEY